MQIAEESFNSLYIEPENIQKIIEIFNSQQETVLNKVNLYKELGGEEVIQAFVEELYQNVMKNKETAK